MALPRPHLLGSHLSQSPRLFHPGSLGLIQVTRSKKTLPSKCPTNLIYFPGVLQRFVVCLPVYLLFVNRNACLELGRRCSKCNKATRSPQRVPLCHQQLPGTSPQTGGSWRSEAIASETAPCIFLLQKEPQALPQNAKRGSRSRASPVDLPVGGTAAHHTSHYALGPRASARGRSPLRTGPVCHSFCPLWGYVMHLLGVD
uniref:Uncharacterized protein n=1 Tax=Myotis myotis TaxID=51298 RepID=A0A7J7V3S6_MYOMY|nr:hypothetical protein mMyoMyo1_008430 [Myotis myotis]